MDSATSTIERIRAQEPFSHTAPRERSVTRGEKTMIPNINREGSISSKNSRRSSGWLSSYFTFLLLSLLFIPLGLAQATNYDVSINDVTVYEDQGKATFTISLDKPIAPFESVTVNYKTADDTAQEPGDYVKIDPAINVMFLTGQQTKTFDVTVNNDGLIEGFERFYAQIGITAKGGLANPTLIKDKGYATIAVRYGISVDDRTVNEGQIANFTVSLSQAVEPSDSVTVSYQTNDDTATGGGTDYNSHGLTLLTFTAGQSTKTIPVTTLDDNLVEKQEHFTVALSNESANATISDDTGDGYINDDGDKYQISIDSPVAVTEGGNVVFTVSLHQDVLAGQTVTVDYATVDDTAVQPGDYTQISTQTMTFNAGEGLAGKTISVTTLDDTLVENQEHFTVALSNASANATISDATGDGYIDDDGDKYQISIDNPVAVTEGDNVVFTVSLHQNVIAGQSVTVDYATVDDTAVQPGDYTQISATTLTFNPGEGLAGKAVTVTTQDDGLYEVQEHFTVALSNASANATINTGVGDAYIDDDGDKVQISINDPAAVTEGGNITFTVTLSQDVPTGQTVTVDYATVDDTAVQPGDYTQISTQTMTFNAGEGLAGKTITVTTLDDTLVENQEHFTVALSNASANATISDATGDGYIDDDGDKYQISIDSPVAVTEGGNVAFTVSLHQDVIAGQSVTVDYATVDDTALQPGDYTQISATTLTFNPGEGLAGKAVTVTTLDDSLYENQEHFTVALSNASANATINTGVGDGYIDDDGDKVQISINDPVAVTENGSIIFTVTLSQDVPTGQTVTVDYATADDTAVQPGDYTRISTQTMTFNAGEGLAGKTITVTTLDDTLVENQEHFTVALSNASANATISDATGDGYINDDGDKYQISIDSPVAVTEGGNVVFTVSLHQDVIAGQTVTVDYATGDDTAVQPGDYTQISATTLTFNPGEGLAGKPITVTTLDDGLYEVQEHFTVGLSNASANATIISGVGDGYIDDDGDKVQISINDPVAVTEGGSMTFTVTLSQDVPLGETVFVQYETSDDSAAAPGDYTQVAPQILTFNGGEGLAGKTISVTTLDDNLVENQEHFTVALSNASANATISDGTGDGYIDDDGDKYRISIDNPVAVTEGGNVAFTVSLHQDVIAGQTVTVDYATADDTAAQPGDYTQISATTLTFNPGEGLAGKAVTVTTQDDSLYENQEHFTVGLSNASANATIISGVGDGYIDDDGDKVQISINDPVAVTENGSIIFTVTLSQDVPTGQTVTVDYATADDTAVQPGDYTRISTQTMTFNAGEGLAGKTITVTTLDDNLVENQEHFTVALSNASANATISDGTGDGYIDDDGDKYQISIDSPVAVTEGGNVVFTVSLHQDVLAGQSVTVDYATGDDTAVQPGDYTQISATTLTFNPGEGLAGKAVTVTTQDDALYEVQEHFTVALSNASANATISDGTGDGYIDDDGDKVQISIDNPAAVTEGGNMTFTVTLSQDVPTGQTVTVDYATVDDTAVQPGDYTRISTQTMTFNAGEGLAGKTITVTTLDDSYVENQEHFTVALSNASANAAISDGTGDGYIDDDGDTHDVAIDSPAAVAENAGPITFTVTLSNVDPSNGVAAAVSVDYATGGGSATAGTDYTAVGPVTMTFNPGDGASKTFDVTLLNDAHVENAETFQVTLSNFTGTGMTGAPGTGTISDDGTDGYNVTIDSPDPVIEGTGAKITFTVTLSNIDPVNGISRVVNVDYATAGGNATAGTDYTAIATTTMTFNPGDGASKTFDVTVLNDSLVENAETFQVTLSNFDGGGSTGGPGTGTINDDADVYNVSVTAPTPVTEANTNAVFTLQLANVDPTHGVIGTVQVDYATGGGNAIAGSDYTATSGTWTFAAATETVNVPVLNDTLVENNETFDFTLSSLSAGARTGSITAASGTATIQDDGDTYDVALSAVAPSPVGEADTPVTFTIDLANVDPTHGVIGTVQVDYATGGGNATAGTDYTAAGGTLTIDAATKTLDVDILNDDLVENNETFTLTLSNFSGGARTGSITDNSETVTIADDADVYNVSVTAPAPVTEANTNAVFTLQLANVDPTHGVIGTVQVDYATGGGNAIAGSDYTATSGTWTFAAATQTVNVPVLNDTLVENNETFDFTLTNFSAGARTGNTGAAATGTIVDDGDIYSISIANAVPFSIVEGANASFTVSVDASTLDPTHGVVGPVTVSYTTTDGSAKTPGDYTAASGTLTFNGAVSSQDITVATINDPKIEYAEDFHVDLSSPSANAVIGTSRGTCEIAVADVAGITVDDVSVNEGDGTVDFTVSLTDQAEFDIDVTYTTTNGSALAGSDYATTAGTLTIAAGSVTGTITVPILNPTPVAGNDPEAPEIFFLDLLGSLPGGVTAIDGSRGQCTISDNDRILTLQINWLGGSGSATVTASSGDPSGASGGSAGDLLVYDSADMVTLTTSDTLPFPGYIFKGWTGDATGTDYTFDIAMGTDKTVTANFNATYTLAITKTGSGEGRGSVAAGTGNPSSLPGGTVPGVYLYEHGDAVVITATAIDPTETVTGCRFDNWTTNYGDTGSGFASGSESTTVTMTEDTSVEANFTGKYMITSIQRTGGTITPVGSTIKYYGETQSYAIAAIGSYVNSDVVVDKVSQGVLENYTFNNIDTNHEIVAVFVPAGDYIDRVTAGDDQIYRASVPPMVLLVMGKDHKLYYEAYNDTSDLNGDGSLDVGYKPNIDYYGYFDSYKTYVYNSGSNRFEPSRVVSDKKATLAGEWSGDFLNYLAMSRIDVLRKVLYGGYRSIDTATQTELLRAYIPQDAHSWGKEYESVERDGYDIRDYTPLDLPPTDPGLRRLRHLFANTTLELGTTVGPDLDRPLLRVLTNSPYRIWEWVSIERPVAGTQCDIVARTDCARVASEGGVHPGHPTNHTQFQALVDLYAVPAQDFDPTNTRGTHARAEINGSGNPFDLLSDNITGPPAFTYHDNQNYLTIFTGTFHVTTPGSYTFAVNGDDAVEVLVNGVVRAGWYNSHGRCTPSTPDPGNDRCAETTKGSPVFLSTGNHTLEFRHEEKTGGDYYYCYYKGPDTGDRWAFVTGNYTMRTYKLLTTPTPESVMTDYVVKVLVGDASMPEPNCKLYGTGAGAVYKPTGILQKYGEPGKLLFGLMTGSYTKNTSGGVLRKAIGSMADEINSSTGEFKYKDDSNVQGIVKTIDNLRFKGFQYNTGVVSTSYRHNEDCGTITTAPLSEGQCRMWGNPVAEMMYEALRYYGGGTTPAPTSDFTYSSTDGALDDNILGLPLATWDDPFVTNNFCSKPFILAISDINPSYDSNQLPGVTDSFVGSPVFSGSFTSADSPAVALDVESVANAISTAEGITGSYFIGEVGATKNSSCSPKDTTGYGFGSIRGLCPEEPTKQGSYYSAAVAHFGRTHDVSASTDVQNPLTYAVALASPLPKIEIKVGTKLITLVPFGKTVYGGTTNPIILTEGAFQPTNTIVDVYIQSLTYTSGSFRINFEDVEQGSDHDMDVIVVYDYQVLDASGNPVPDPILGSQVRITLRKEYQMAGYNLHVGYIISGTTNDGIYLEVASKPTNDRLYFLDTPQDRDGPGRGSSTMYLSDGVVDDNEAYSRTRIFTPGATAAATILKDPLWYAAKWGGFTDLNGTGTPDLDSEWDADGDGMPDTYFYVVNPLKLDQQLNRAFSAILSRGTSHVAPVVSVDEANRTQSGDKLFLAFFKPVSDGYWQGNLKKYGLEYVETLCPGRTEPEWTLMDSQDPAQIAGNCDGTFKLTSRSYWSTQIDGGYVDRGGAGERLLAAMPGSDPVTPPTSGPYWSFRNIYTYKGATDGSLVKFIHANIDNTDLQVSDDYTRYRILNFMYGYTYDSKTTTNPDPREKRDWILGDIIHSEPKLVEYIDPTDGTVDYRFIVVGANDGMLHVFVDGVNPTDTQVTIGGVDYPVGMEIFAFIPRDFLPRLQEFSNTNVHPYMVDGSTQIIRSSVIDAVTGYNKTTLVFGERRGGRSYWALDITDPNPLNWKVKWYIHGGPSAISGTTGFEELGYTFSKPFLTTLKTGPNASDVKNVMVIAGGYDLLEDGFPEAFDDADEDGAWDTGETYAVTIGGSEIYDTYNPTKDSMGRGIFVVDIDKTQNDSDFLLFKATYGETDVTTGVAQTYNTMKYCFPADVSVIPFSPDRLVMYAADIYGRIWKITYNWFAEDEALAYSATSSRRWTVTRIFDSNPGSDMPSGSAEAFNAGPSLVSTDAGRKTFYSPDISYFGNDWTSWPVLYFGTGDREHPRYTMISNRFYVVTDDGTFADETDLLNLTCDELDTDATIAPEVKEALSNILTGGGTPVRGWYRVLGLQGSCDDDVDTADHTGESVLSQPTLFSENVYFTTYQPTFDDPCNPLGNAYIYALDYSFGTATFDYFGDISTTDNVQTLKDTYRKIEGTSIPSGIKVITREGVSAGMVSVGGAIVGAGEGGSTTIPGPPSGITPLLWETE